MCGQWQAIHSQIRHTRGQFSCAGFAAAAETSRRASLIRGQIPPTLRSCFAHRASLRNPTPSSTTFLKKRQPTILSVPFFKFPLYTPNQIKQPAGVGSLSRRGRILEARARHEPEGSDPADSGCTTGTVSALSRSRSTPGLLLACSERYRLRLVYMRSRSFADL